MPRKLVTLRRVTGKRPITGADRVELVEVGGWQCVTGINEFQVGDMGVFFEIDSFLPATDSRFAFLSQKFIESEGARGFRVKTMKMRGELSQGLMVPMAMFPELEEVYQDLAKKVGETAAGEQIGEIAFEDKLGVKKFEKPAMAGAVGDEFVGALPEFFPRTEQERCQNMRHVFTQCLEDEFQETTKMDGSSMTVYFVSNDSYYKESLPPASGKTLDLPNGRVGVCSRNRELAITDNGQFWAVAKANSLPQKLAKLNRSVAIQGELCGSSIQSNFEGFPKGYHDFYLFSVFDIEKQRFLPPREVEEAWTRELGVKHVPVVGYSKLKDIAGSMQELLQRAEGKGINGKKREGIVLKEVDGKFSFKAISNSYLLKHGE
jgi:RNA ligase (TIGR02306 family)